ncbi:TetR/AcrR family transcriptional regulator [Litoreibacter ponti]|nr:TetR/AcrR family transcriptional regulator [Litoreibacter ponti]
MARPREFDTDEALEAAMHVFWEHGYEGASLPDLLTGMGLTRGSLYKAFDDKHSLFLRVLTRYEEGAVARAETLLSTGSATDGFARITQLFDNAIGVVQSGDRRGCLLCSAAAGPSAYDPEIAAAVKQGLEKIRDGFATALDASQVPEPERAALADLLVTQYVGVRIMARSRDPLEPLARAGDAIRVLLSRW